MNDRDLVTIQKAKRQIDREATWRSFLLFGLVFAAVLRLLGLELPILYAVLFVFVFVSLLLSSDLFINFGLVSKKDLVKVIESHIHNDPETLTRYANIRERQ